MIKLSKRLKAIASLIETNEIIDIGCDHAFLDIYLIQNNNNLKITASDNKLGALKQAENNINKYNIKNINLCLSDGLDKVDVNNATTIVISGLGNNTIIDILKKDNNKLKNINNIIVQSNKGYYELRKSICNLGFYIDKELLVKERDIFYIIIRFKRGNKKYSNKDYLYGPYLRLHKDALFKEMILNEIKQKEIILSLIPRKRILGRLLLKLDIINLNKEIRFI